MQQIKIATNYNNKLGNKYMIHLDAAPGIPITEKDLPKQFEFVTADGSHPPIVYELFCVQTGDLNMFFSDLVTYQSHGMERFEFAKWYLERRPHEKNNPPMAIYFYCLVLQTIL